MQAMILAAGFGTRLLPHSRLRPKPLFPLFNQPLLLLTIRRLRRLGFGRIVVNCHHLCGQIEEAVDGYDVIVEREQKILGTGGGLRNAMVHFDKDKPVLVTNGDIYHTIDIEKLFSHHLRHNRRITLAMHHFPRFNSVSCQDGLLAGFSEKSVNSLAYTGVQVLNPDVLDGIDPDSYSCIISHYRNLLGKGEKISCLRIDKTPGFFWTDIGTPEDYLQLHEDLLQGRVLAWSELQLADSPFICAADIDRENLECSSWAVVGQNVRFGRGCSLDRCVVWDDLDFPAGTNLKNTIVSGALDE